jgi:hypothetical protein
MRHLMEQTPEQDELRLYLLGLLPQERLPRLEERLLTDEELYEELLIAEDELIDQYLAGELPAREREGFESHFMNAPERSRQLRFAASLRRFVNDEGATAAINADEPSAESRRGIESVESVRGVETIVKRDGFLSWLRARPVLTFSTAVVLLLVFGLTWVALRGLRTGEPRQVFAVALTPELRTRSGGGDAQQVSMPAGTDALRLQLRLADDDFQSYETTLVGPDGATVLTADGLKPEQSDGGRVVNVVVPAQSTPPGEYQVKLVGVHADGSKESADGYRFKVVSR